MKEVRRLQKRPQIKMKYVTVAQCHHYKVIKAMKTHPKANIKNMKGGKYLHLRSGEIREHKSKGKSKEQSLQSFQRSMEKLKLLILENVDDDKKLHYRFITLTYDSVMRDLEQLKKDWASFWNKLCYYAKKELGDKKPPKYILVREPQGNGSFHFHVIVIWSHKAPFLDNDEVIAKFWGHGYTHTTAVRCKAIQLAEYLTNMAKHMTPADYSNSLLYHDRYEREDTSVINERNGRAEKEIRIKNARIALYPCDMRVYDASHGLKRPETKQIDYRDLDKELRNAGKLIEAHHYAVMDMDSNHSQELSDDETAEQAVQVVSHYTCYEPREIHDLRYAIREKERQESRRKEKCKI